MSLLEVVAFLCFAPATIVTHYGADIAYGTKYTLFIYPLLLICLGEIMYQVTKHYRKNNGLGSLQLLTPMEWQFFAVLVVVLVVFTGMMVYQIGLVR
ncbi:hypothetical protein AB9M75_03120 [Lactobacillus sp. AN1001]